MTQAAIALENEVLAKILLVEDDAALREALRDTLLLGGYEPLMATCAEEAVELLKKDSHISMVVSDVNMGEMSGHDLLTLVKHEYPHLPVLLVTAYASIQSSIDAIRHGAVDYLVKPFAPDSLIKIIKQHVNGNNSEHLQSPVAEAASSKQLLSLASRVAQSDSTVLIMGESGTGKEVLARYVHEQSSRADKPFVAINCAAIPDNMLEAILFGYEKGAYTGAYNSSPGKFEQANGGTLLLDEISEMAIGLQAKLLRVIQEQEVERLGGRKNIPLDVRIIATSNRDMQSQVSNGDFREDLYYRLSVLPLMWKPLRERIEDIHPLANRLLLKHAKKQNRSGVCFDTSARIALENYQWPGNVRELDNVVQRALILQTGQTISDQDLGLDITHQLYDVHNPSRSSQETTFSGAPLPTESKTVLLGDDLKKREFEIILDTLRQEKGSRKKTAERLGISTRTLRYKVAAMRDMGMDVKALIDD